MTIVGRNRVWGVVCAGALLVACNGDGDNDTRSHAERNADAPFDIEMLYRRTEPVRAIAIGLAVLIQAAYLRPFYRRAWFIIASRARRLLGGA